MAVGASLNGALGAVSAGRDGAAMPLEVTELLIDEAVRDATAAVMARSIEPGRREWGLRAMVALRCLRRIGRHALRVAAQTGPLTEPRG